MANTSYWTPHPSDRPYSNKTRPPSAKPENPGCYQWECGSNTGKVCDRALRKSAEFANRCLCGLPNSKLCHTKKNVYPLLQNNAILDNWRTAKEVFNWLVPSTEESKPVTTFRIPGHGFFQFRVMLFGFHPTSTTFERLLDHVIAQDMEPKDFAYLHKWSHRITKNHSRAFG